MFQINWQERCLELQLELHRSKNQAGRIRDMLREKVGTRFFLLIFFFVILLDLGSKVNYYYYQN